MTTARVDENYKVEIKRTFNATCERLFKAWTDPKAITAWMCPSPTIHCHSADIDLKEGGKFRIEMRHPDGDTFVGTGEYTEVDPPTRLCFTWKWDESSLEPGTSLITVDITPDGNKSNLTFVHSKLASQESATEHEDGWTTCINSLEAYISNEAKQ